jgi:ribonuclease P protein component
VSVTAVLDPDGQTIGGPPRSGPDVAFAIGRHVGSAVLRNRIRRRLRPIVASLELPDGAYLLTASAEAADLRFDDLRGHVEQAAAAAIARGDTP